MTMMIKLQRSEKEALVRCETVIAAGVETFILVGKALIEIHDKKLYREEFESFREYAQTKWGMGRSHAYRLMDAAKVVANVSPSGGTSGLTEHQLRPLTALSPEDQVAVFKEAQETAKAAGRPMTANDIKVKVEAKKHPQQATRDEPKMSLIGDILPISKQEEQPLNNLPPNSLDAPNLDKICNEARLHDVLILWDHMGFVHRTEFLRQILLELESSTTTREVVRQILKGIS